MRYISTHLLGRQVWVFDGSGLGGHIGQRATISTSSIVFLTHELFNGSFDLSAKVCAVKRGLVDLFAAALTVPAQTIDHVLGSTLLEDYAHSVGEADRVMRGVSREEEHVAFVDDDIAEYAIVDNLEHHGAFVLVEPFGCLVDVIVGSGIGSADNHDREVFIVDTVVIDGRFQEMRVLIQPGLECQRQGLELSVSTMKCSPLGKVQGWSKHL